MGDWTAVIIGHGIHNNRDPRDADVIIEAAVRALLAAGQVVEHASLTSSGRTDLLEGKALDGTDVVPEEAEPEEET